MKNPAGYLYRIGERRARRQRRVPVIRPDVLGHSDPWFEPGLAAALRSLSDRQRQAVVLIEGYEFKFREAADLLGLSISSVQTHYERGLAHLRDALGVKP